MTTNTNTLNGIASGTAVTTGNSGSTSGTAFASVAGTAVAQSTSAFEGATGLALTSASGALGYVSWLTNSGVSIRDTFSFYFKIDALPNSGAALNIFVHGALQLFITSAGTIKVYNAGVSGGAVLATSAAISTGTWYFIQ